MSQWDKLIKKILALSSNVRFEELCKVLKKYGYRMDSPRSGSSHYSFRKSGKTILTIPKKTPVSRPYLEMVRNIVLEEEKNEKRS